MNKYTKYPSVQFNKNEKQTTSRKEKDIKTFLFLGYKVQNTQKRRKNNQALKKKNKHYYYINK